MAASLAGVEMELLPARLMRFFQKYPPTQYSATATGQVIPTIKTRIEMGAKPLSAKNVPQESSIPKPTEPLAESTPIPTSTVSTPSGPDTDTAPSSQSSSFPPNPFLPYRNPSTGRWRGARIGLRQQADLFKLARQHEVEDLLPASMKSSTYKQARALERGLRIKGTGEGQHVKGHKWERQKVVTLEKRKKAMEEMPELIRLWEQRGHGRGWKKFPSK